MLARTPVLLVAAAVPFVAHAQAAASAGVEAHKNVFAIQPWSDNASGPRLELERAVTRKLSLVLGSRLTLRNPAFAGRQPVFSAADLGARYYLRGKTFRGPFAGLYLGYDRSFRGYGSDNHYPVARTFIGATIGHDFVVFRRLIIGPALGAEYGRPDPYRGVRTWDVEPRLGFGFNFE
jgi:hypothetical protein